MAYPKLQGSKAKAVTPSNTDNISYGGNENYGNVLFVGVGGDVRVLTAGGDDIIFKNIKDGSFIPMNVLRVFATSTTATNIIAIW